MRRLALPAILALAAACAPQRADLQVFWTFDGLSCADAGVATIGVAIEGERLTPDRFSCADAGKGADLGTYLVGNYNLTVTGYDANGNALYQTIQQINVQRGGTSLNIDVPSGTVALRWTFDGKTCAAAGVTVVNASVDNQILTDGNNNADLPCSQAGTDGVVVGPLTTGQHSFDLVGKVGGNIKYAFNGLQVGVTIGLQTQASVNLLPAAPTGASADLKWTFDGKSCAAAGVAQVQIFVDPDASGNGGIDAGTVPCSTSGTDGAAVDGLSAGNHSFAILGINNGHLLYRTHHPPTYSFRVGLITDVTVSAESPP